MYKAGKATGNYHGQMNSDNFEKCVNEKVFPNLATPSVSVMGNAPNHGKQVDKPPTKSSLKKDIMEYLRRHRVPCEEGMKKFTLFSLFEKFRPKKNVYHIDTLFAAHCHTVIRLPPYMFDLNPVELAWRQIKGYVRSHNTAGDVTNKTARTCARSDQGCDKRRLRRLLSLLNKH
jgi:transposase